MSGCENLVVWHKAMALAECAYRLSEAFPIRERFALADQVRRSAISVPSNIAEGRGVLPEESSGNFLAMPEALCMSLKHRFVWPCNLNMSVNR